MTVTTDVSEPRANASPAVRRMRDVTRGTAVLYVAAGVIVLAVAAAVLAPLIAPHRPTGGSILDALAPPSADHPLGTDSNGNDILSRLLLGARPSLLGPLAVVTLSLLAGVPLALASAWRGGLVDRLIGRFLDLVFCFPSVLLASILVIMFGRGLTSAIIAVAVAYVPWTARITRTAALRERAKPYILACEVQGLSAVAIAVRHLLPNLSRLVIAQATTSFGFALIDLAALSFVGLGIDPPAPDWGVMAADTTSMVQGNYTGPIASALCIVVVVGAFTAIGNRLSEGPAEDA